MSEQECWDKLYKTKYISSNEIYYDAAQLPLFGCKQIGENK